MFVEASIVRRAYYIGFVKGVASAVAHGGEAFVAFDGRQVAPSVGVVYGAFFASQGWLMSFFVLGVSVGGCVLAGIV